MDDLLITLLRKSRNNGLLLRFTIGLRILLAVAFIPTGAIKLLGRRFAMGVPEEGSPVFLFEALYQSLSYWHFIGLAQVVAGLLILFYRTSTVGAVMYLAIALNILFITLSYDFGWTLVVSIGLTLGCLWLMFWHWDRLRFLVVGDIGGNFSALPCPSIKSKFERGLYTCGFVSGLVLFSVLRGLELPIYMVYLSILLSATSFLFAVVVALKNFFWPKPE